MVKKDKFGKFYKDKMTQEVASRFKKDTNFIVTSFMGSSVSDLEQLRKNLKKTSSSYFVVKNSTLRVIFNNLKMDEMMPFVDGGVGISLSGDDIIATCKALVGFTKDHDKFKIRAGFIDGRLTPAERLKELASLPSREVLLARVVWTIKSPITCFVNTLSGVLRKFVYVVEAIRSNREKTAPGNDAPAQSEGPKEQPAS